MLRQTAVLCLISFNGTAGLTPALQNLPLEDMLPPEEGDADAAAGFLSSEWPPSSLLEVTPLVGPSEAATELLSETEPTAPPLEIVALQGIELRRFGRRCDDAEEGVAVPLLRGTSLKLPSPSGLFRRGDGWSSHTSAAADPVAKDGVQTPDDFLQIGSVEADEVNASAMTLVQLLEIAGGANQSNDTRSMALVPGGAMNSSLLAGNNDVVNGSSLAKGASSPPGTSYGNSSPSAGLPVFAPDASRLRTMDGSGGTQSFRASDVDGMEVGLGTLSQKPFSHPTASWLGTAVLIAGVLVLALTCISLVLCVVPGVCLTSVCDFFSWMWPRSEVRSHVEALPLTVWDKVKLLLPDDDRYDCAFSKPLSTRSLVRLEAVVVLPSAPVGNFSFGVATGGEGASSAPGSLTTPLTQQPCVVFSAVCSRRLHEGVPCVPLAFASASMDFFIAPVDAPNGTRIRIRGDDLSLFDICRGKFEEQRHFASAPEHWQDFVLAHRAESFGCGSGGGAGAGGVGSDWQTSAALRTEGALLDFQECALLLGATATFVGELHRAADGALSLRPLRPESDDCDLFGASPSADTSVHSCSAARTREPWRTSWECGAGPVATPGAASLESSLTGEPSSSPSAGGVHPLRGQVFASDDPWLLRRHLETRTLWEYLGERLLGGKDGARAGALQEDLKL